MGCAELETEGNAVVVQCPHPFRVCFALDGTLYNYFAFKMPQNLKKQHLHLNCQRLFQQPMNFVDWLK
jgi:hypothetical protein